jgi:uncharacterized protein (DUF1697 family)
MTTYIALLRAVNVGGTGTLAMSDLVRLCEEAGFRGARTYIASGNVVFASDLGETQVKARLEKALHDHAGRAVGVAVRTAGEMAAVLKANPFPDAAPKFTVAIFLDEPPPKDAADKASGRAENEEIALGARELYVSYGSGMGRSKLKIPAAKAGTARNMNTVAKLSEMAAGIEG